MSDKQLDKRRQVNVRLPDEEVGMIRWLQRHSGETSKVPSVNAVVARVIREAYERERGDKRAARR